MRARARSRALILLCVDTNVKQNDILVTDASSHDIIWLSVKDIDDMSNLFKHRAARLVLCSLGTYVRMYYHRHWHITSTRAASRPSQCRISGLTLEDDLSSSRSRDC